MVLEKINAFKKLIKIAKTGSFKLYETSKDCCSKIAYTYPVNWSFFLKRGCFESKMRQQVLDMTLEYLSEADLPDSVKQMQQERKLVRLILEAGGNPNYYGLMHRRKVFDTFLLKGQSHIALEIAKSEEFTGPENIESIFGVLIKSLDENSGKDSKVTKKESTLNVQKYSVLEELGYTLFQQGVYPRDKEVFERLAPIILKKDPEFFNKRKEQTITQLKHAKTPIQVFNALMGKRKEKS